MNILGISAFYHDSAAALIRDGAIIAAAQEERFSRKKNDHAFPHAAIRYCLAQGDIGRDGLDAVVFYDKPIVKFARILQTHLSVAPAGFRSFVRAIPLWLKKKLWTPLEVEKSLAACGRSMPRDMYYTEHHEAHAASAFYPSPFERAAILTVDGVGEWACTSLGRGEGSELRILKEQHFPHSLGLLYSAFTYFTGFEVNSGEYKLMGLAPYGEPRYERPIREHLVDIGEDGSIRLNLDYFGYLGGLTMTNRRFADLFGGPRREPEGEITAREADLARSIQAVTEEIMFRLVRHAHRETGEENLCLAGGVALNCVANGKIVSKGPFRRVWIQPAAGDAGGALGAAMRAWYLLTEKERSADGVHDQMRGAYLGPQFADEEIGAFLRERGYPARMLERGEWAGTIAERIAEGKVIGLFQGRMEFGPRALGNRSIIGDPRSPMLQSRMNLKIKYRESFRPFAPSCMIERVGDYFDLDVESPYMLLVAPVKESLRKHPVADHAASVIDRCKQVRSEIPAVTHVDYSARVQTVDRNTNPRYHELIQAFEELTGCGVIVNTSFNVRGEPIVCTPEDAYNCFMATQMDDLVLGSFLLCKEDQPEPREGARAAVGTSL